MQRLERHIAEKKQETERRSYHDQFYFLITNAKVYERVARICVCVCVHVRCMHACSFVCV